MKNPAICFFDVDHTITRRSTGLYFALEAVRYGYIRFHALLSVPRFYLRYRHGTISEEEMVGEFSSLKGVSRTALEELGQRVYDKLIHRDIYPGARDLIRKLREGGSEIVLATSSIDIVINPLARDMGIETVLAGSLEYDDDKCTGRFAGKLFFGENKCKEALAFLSSRGIAPDDCAFYSDSIHDLPLLNAVGKAVAVNPDRRLTRLAREQNWEVITFH